MPFFKPRFKVYKVYHVRIVKRPLRERLALAFRPVTRVPTVWLLMVGGFATSIAAQRLLRRGRDDDDNDDDGSEAPPALFVSSKYDSIRA